MRKLITVDEVATFFRQRAFGLSPSIITFVKAAQAATLLRSWAAHKVTRYEKLGMKSPSV
jgi:hypothetical protein